jgi:hypothetical protein
VLCTQINPRKSLEALISISVPVCIKQTRHHKRVIFCLVVMEDALEPNTEVAVAEIAYSSPVNPDVFDRILWMLDAEELCVLRCMNKQWRAFIDELLPVKPAFVPTTLPYVFPQAAPYLVRRHARFSATGNPLPGTTKPVSLYTYIRELRENPLYTRKFDPNGDGFILGFLSSCLAHGDIRLLAWMLCSGMAHRCFPSVIALLCMGPPVMRHTDEVLYQLMRVVITNIRPTTVYKHIRYDRDKGSVFVDDRKTISSNSVHNFMNTLLELDPTLLDSKAKFSTFAASTACRFTRSETAVAFIDHLLVWALNSRPVCALDVAQVFLNACTEINTFAAKYILDHFPQHIGAISQALALESCLNHTSYTESCWTTSLKAIPADDDPKFAFAKMLIDRMAIKLPLKGKSVRDAVSNVIESIYSPRHASVELFKWLESLSVPQELSKRQKKAVSEGKRRKVSGVRGMYEAKDAEERVDRNFKNACMHVLTRYQTWMDRELPTYIVNNCLSYAMYCRVVRDNNCIAVIPFNK